VAKQHSHSVTQRTHEILFFKIGCRNRCGLAETICRRRWLSRKFAKPQSSSFSSSSSLGRQQIEDDDEEDFPAATKQV
jgi:hypothetical protein